MGLRRGPNGTAKKKKKKKKPDTERLRVLGSMSTVGSSKVDD